MPGPRSRNAGRLVRATTYLAISRQIPPLIRPSVILSVSYDESLLSTRQMLLQQAGYEVTSALGFREALEWCKKGEFDLVLIGHSIPREDKQSLVRVTRMVSQASVLSVLEPTSAPLAEADYFVKSADGPGALVAAVDKALGQDRQ